MKIQRIGPGFGFAKKLSKKTDRKILLVVNARGGTTLSQWTKGEGGAPIATSKSDGKPDLKDPHFDRKSQIKLGERYARKVLKLCY